MPYIAYDPSTAQAAPAFALGAPSTTGSMSLLELRSLLTEKIANRADITLERKDFFLNEAYRHMVMELNLPQFDASVEISLTANQPLYLIPDTVDYIKQNAAIRDAQEYPRGGKVLVYSGLDQYRRLANETGRVSRVYRHGNMIVVWPTPETAETLVLNVQYLPSLLTADNHVPLLPRKYHHAMAVKAAHMVLQHLRQYIDAAALHNDYVNLLRSITDTRAAEITEQYGSFYIPRREEDLAEYNPESHHGL